MSFNAVQQHTAHSMKGGYEHDLTQEEVQSVLPANLRSAATQSFVDRLNGIVQDPMVAEQIRSSFVSYTSVLQQGKFKVEDYLNAVVYCSFRLMGYTQKDSYKRTFPQRYSNLRAQGADDKTISAYVASYNKGKLVTAIMEQSIVPSWILNQDLYQKAINVQAEIMLDPDQSGKVRSDAADSLMTHLKRPEAQEVNVNLGVEETDGMRELKDTLLALSDQQRALIQNGLTTREIAHQRLGESIDGNARDVTPSGSSSGSNSKKA